MPKKSHRGPPGLQHVGLERRLLGDPEFQKLSGSAKIRYLYIKRHYNGNNNGDIKAPYSEMKGKVRGCSSPEVISNADRELEEKGWIENVRRGGLMKYATRYRLTFKFDHYGTPK